MSKSSTSPLKQLGKELRSGEAFLIQNKKNINYICGFTGSSGLVLITRKKAFLLTDFRYWSRAKIAADNKMKAIISTDFRKDVFEICKKEHLKKIFFEEKSTTYYQYKTLKKALPKIKLNPASDIVEKYREVKSKAELQNIIKAQRIAEKTISAVLKKIKAGITEQQIANEIEMTGRMFGAESTSFETIVAFGYNSSVPHHESSGRKLKKGDLILIDMGMKYKGYCSDMTRVYFTKMPTDLQKKIYNLVLLAQNKAIQSVRAGIKANKVDKIARDIIEKAGYGKDFGHATGHGIGLDIHENPRVSSKEQSRLKQGTIITVEPGVYIQKNFGIRIEDMVLVERNKCTNLTRIPKSITNLLLKIE